MDKKEFRRQLFHLFLGIAIVFMLYYGYIDRVHIPALLVMGIVISLWSMRMRIAYIGWFLERFDRSDVILPGFGALTFLLGCTASLYIFPEKIAYATILVLAFGDSIGPLVGLSWGKNALPYISARNIEGFIAAVLASAFAAWVFVPFWIALLGSLAAMLAEAIEVRLLDKIDDNLYIPLIAGVVIYLLM